jgi:DNA-binding MarR family transcriptional regulator
MSSQKQDLTNQADVLAHITRELAQCCTAKENEIFGQFGLSTSEGHVLIAIADGTTSPSGLAEQLGVVRSRITPLAQSLVHKGFLQRLESANDRRVRDLKLTDEGHGAAKEAKSYRLNFHTRLLEKFASDERARLLEMLEHLHDKMTEMRKGIK